MKRDNLNLNPKPYTLQQVHAIRSFVTISVVRQESVSKQGRTCLCRGLSARMPYGKCEHNHRKSRARNRGYCQLPGAHIDARRVRVRPGTRPREIEDRECERGQTTPYS